MRRNAFGDARPANYKEMIEALDERGAIGDEVNASVEFNEGEGEFSGWTAEVRFNDSGDEVFSTLGYPSKEKIIADLKIACIRDIEVIE